MSRSIPEIRHLYCQIWLTIRRPIDWILAWSRWRRRHQAIAMSYHFQHRTARLNHVVQL